MEEFIMRKIENLRNTLNGKVYIFCKDDQTAKEFLVDAEKEGYLFGTIKPTDSQPDDIIAIEENKQLAYVGFVGRTAFQCKNKDNLHKIDYAKYKSGADDYYVRDRE